ncbi:MAG: alanine racemase [Ignavibacteria bacterium]|nr:alanine racemase [Ignavibacteria bacterium]
MGKKSSSLLINDSYAEIDLKALKNNFFIIKKLFSKTNFENNFVCSVVKADAYGHGMLRCAEELALAGTDFLGTADYSESLRLTAYLKAKRINTPVFCMGTLPTSKAFLEVIANENFHYTIVDLEDAKKLNSVAALFNKKLNVQIQVDSGMNRIGFPIDTAYEAIAKIVKMKNLNPVGIYSHFATSEIPKHKFAVHQVQQFKKFVNEVEENLHKFKYRHISNTGGVFNYNENYFNFIRPGISLYGYYPDDEYYNIKTGLNPVMNFESRVRFIKKVQKGRSISYGRKFYTEKDTYIASIPVGYGDGYPRSLTNKGKVLIKNKLYDIVGAVCMDWIMVDIGAKPKVKINDEVILFGKEYPVYELAKMARTIPYEITSSITPRIPRIYINKSR